MSEKAEFVLIERKREGRINLWLKKLAHDTT